MFKNRLWGHSSNATPTPPRKYQGRVLGPPSVVWVHTHRPGTQARLAEPGVGHGTGPRQGRFCLSLCLSWKGKLKKENRNTNKFGSELCVCGITLQTSVYIRKIHIVVSFENKTKQSAQTFTICFRAVPSLAELCKPGNGSGVYLLLSSRGWTFLFSFFFFLERF